MPLNYLVDLKNFPKAQALMKAVFSGQYRVIVYGGAIRGGKSFNLLAALVIMLRRYPGMRAAIIRKDLPTLRRATYPTCRKVFPRGFMTLKNATSFVWQAHVPGWPDGEIFFFPESIKSDPELERFDGLEVNAFLIDQIEEVEEKTFLKCLERVGSYIIPGYQDSQLPPPIILASVNPTKNWVRRLIYDRWKAGTLPEDWLYIPAKITDNPHIPQSYLDSLETLRWANPTEYVRRVEGDWDYQDNDLALYDYEALADLPYNSFVEGGKKYITADIAMDGADKFVVMVWDGWKVAKTVTMEKITDSSRIVKTIEQLARQYMVPRSQIVYDADGVGSFLNGYLRGAKRFKNGSRPLPPKRAPGAEPENYENLKTQCYYLLREKINQRSMWVPCESKQQDEILEELGAIARRDPDKDGPLKMSKKEDLKKKLGRSPDYADTIAMRMYFELLPSRRSPGAGTV